MNDRRLLFIVGSTGAAILLAVLLMSLLFTRHPAAAPTHAAPASAERVPTLPAHRPAHRTVKPPAQSTAVASRPGAPLPPVIDEITVEKEEVCEGEENLITVKAHAQHDAAPLLHVAIGSGRGSSVPVRTWLDPRTGEPMRQPIAVFGRAEAFASVDVPPFRVKRCRPERMLMVSVRSISNRVDDFEVSARLFDNAPEKPFHPTRYLWDFGDGERTASETPYTTHRYHQPIQKTLYFTYLVQVEAVGESGESVLGRTSFERYNLGYEHLVKFGVVALFGEGHPRFPELGDDGVVHQKFEIWHTYEQPVEIQKISLVRHDFEGRRTETAEEADLALLNDTEILPGKSIEAQLKFDTTKYPGVLALVFHVEGTSADGRRAVGEFSVMKPPPKPTRENSKPITDPKLLAKVQKALQILGTDTVSQEDLWHLERVGKLQ